MAKLTTTDVYGILTAHSNVVVKNSVTANKFYGDGSSLTGVSGGSSFVTVNLPNTSYTLALITTNTVYTCNPSTVQTVDITAGASTGTIVTFLNPSTYTSTVTLATGITYTIQPMDTLMLSFDGTKWEYVNKPSGAAISNWTATTVTANPTNQTTSAWYSRIGPSAMVRVRTTFNGTPSSFSGFVLTLPSILTMDYTMVNVQESSVVGNAKIARAGSSQYNCDVFVSSTNSVTLRLIGVAAGNYGQDASVTQAIPLTLQSGDVIEASFTIPITSWTSNINLVTDFTEYGSNDGLSTVNSLGSTVGIGAAGSTYNTGMVYGNFGSRFPSVASTTAASTTVYKVRFSRNVQPTDKLFIEVSFDTGQTWLDLQSAGGYLVPQVYQLGNIYGMACTALAGTTDVAVAFGNYGSMNYNTAYGTTGYAWSNTAGMAALRWRIRKVSNGNMAEQQPLTSAIGNWTPYSPVVTAVSVNPTNGVRAYDNSQWRRVGSNMEIEINFQATTGWTTGTGVYFLSMPTGYTTSVLGNTVVGNGEILAGSNSYSGTAFVQPNSLIYFDFYSSTLGQWASTSLPINTNPVYARMVLSVPIAQWTSNINLMTDFTEYAYNTSTTTTTDTSSFGYGPEGVLFQAFAPTGNALIAKVVRFTRPIRVTDTITVEMLLNGVWVDLGIHAAKHTDSVTSPTVTVGHTVTPTNLTDVGVEFYSKANASNPWSNYSALKWRVRKVSNGNTAEANVGGNTWVSTYPYSTGTVVSYNNSLYIAIQPSTGVLPTNTSYWVLGGGGGSSVSTFSVTTGENISIGQPVYIGVDTLAYVASKQDQSKVGVCGIAAETKTTGQAIIIQQSGVMTYASWNFVAGDPVYLGNAGSFTQNLSNIYSYLGEPVVAVGTAISATKLAIATEVPIMLGTTNTDSSAISGWTSYAPTISGLGTGSVSASNASWRRVGSNMEIRGDFTKDTSAGSGATFVSVSLPLGYTPETLATGRDLGYWNAGALITPTTIYPSGGILVNVIANQFVFRNNTSGNLYSALTGANLLASGVIEYFCSIPISQWTSNINLVTDYQEFAYNNGINTTGNDTSSFGYGADGAYFTANTSALNRQVRFQTPIKPTDIIQIEVKYASGNGEWVPLLTQENQSGICPLMYQNSIKYGVGRSANESLPNTDVNITFGLYAYNSGSTFGAVGAAWSSFTTHKWRVRKISNGNMSESPTNSIVLLAGEALIAGQAIYMDTDKTAKVATISNLNKLNVMGFASSTVASGSSVRVRTSGLFANTSWSLTPGQVCYLYGSGGVVQDLDLIQSSINQPIVALGKATATDTIDVKIETPIITGSVDNSPYNVISGWTSYTPAIVLQGGATVSFGSNATISGRWRRVGSDMDIEFELNQTTAATAQSGIYTVGLPIGYSIDFTKYTNGMEITAGIAFASTSGTNAVSGHSDLNSALPTIFRLWLQSSAYNVMGFWGNALYTNANNPLTVSAKLTVPISQWTVNVATSTDFQEFAYNTSTTTTTDSTSFGNGPQGCLIQAYGPSTLTASIQKRVRFLSPIQPNDMLLLEYYQPAAGIWEPFAGNATMIGTFQTNDAATIYYGASISPINSTDVDVFFYSLPFPGGSNWSSGLGKWRVRKISNGNFASTNLIANEADSFIRRAIYRYNTTDNVATQWIHMKTSIPVNAGYSVMHGIHFYGYSFGEVKTVDCMLGFYSYGAGPSVINIASSGTHTCSAYKSADNFVVMTISVTNTYYLGFLVDQIGAGPIGLVPMSVTASTHTGSSTGAY